MVPRGRKQPKKYSVTPPPVPVVCDTYLGGAGPSGAVQPGNHLPPAHKLTRTNREQIARNYKGISYNLVKGPLAYDTEKQLDRGLGMRSDTDVVGYLRAPKLVVPAISAPQMLGSISTTREERQWNHGGTWGARPIGSRTSMPGASDNPKNRVAVENPWAADLGFAKEQLASNPLWIGFN
jgi:hypothetical protein